MTDLDNPKILLVYSDFKKIIKDLKQSHDKGSLGIILIPSAQVVHLNTLEKLNIKPDSKCVYRYCAKYYSDFFKKT